MSIDMANASESRGELSRIVNRSQNGILRDGDVLVEMFLADISTKLNRAETPAAGKRSV